MKNKTIALLLASAMVVASLVGCGKAEEKESTPASESTNAEENASEETVEEEETSNYNATGYPIVNETITLNVLVAMNNDETVVNPNVVPGIIALEEKTNIHVEWELVKAADFDTRLNLIMASGEYPDVIIAQQAGGLDYENYGVDQGILIPLDEYLSNAELMPNFVERMAGESFNPCETLIASDGQQYAFPYLQADAVPISWIHYVNKTWIDYLGLEYPTNIEELTDVFRAFRDGDPNQNGEADEIPFLAGTNAGEVPLNKHSYLFGIPDEGIYVDDKTGKIAYGGITEEYREYVEWLNLCYEEKLLDQEVFTQDMNAAYAKLQEDNPKVGFFVAWYRPIAGGGMPQNDQMDQFVCEGALYPGKKNYATASTFVTCQNENVEATMRWIDTWIEEEMMNNIYNGPYSETGETEYSSGWTYNADGKISTSVGNPDAPKGDFKMGVNGLLFRPTTYMEQNMYQGEVYQEKAEDGITLRESGLTSVHTSQEVNTSILGFSAEDLEWRKDVNADLNTAKSEALVDFVMNGVTDEKWDAYIATMEDIGVNDLIAMYQTYYDAKNN